MREKSRTEHSFQNTTAAMISRVVAILMGFITRVVFTHTLSESYVGVNGLFSDILNVLSLSELGVGTAITFALYKPIAENNIELQKSLMKLYKKFYYVVAGIVLAAGLAVIPFMGVLINNQPEVDHLVLIYLLYLGNSVVSYLLIYKRTLIDAHQLSYIGVVCQTVFLVIQDVLQIILLITTKNFVLFLIVYIVCTIGNNLWISRKADKLYPFLKDKDVEPLEKEQKQDIIKNIKAMLMHKVGNVVINNTDNLLLSSMVGIVSVGCYSNYYLVIGSVRQVLNQMFQGIMASVGNLGVTKDSVHVKKIFETSFFVGQWMFGFATICLFELVSLFVGVSFGQQYVFSELVVLVLCLNFYVTGMRQAVLVFRDSLGLFWYDRYKAVLEAVLNLVISIVLAYHFGTVGVFLGTLFSALLSSVWIEPLILYKHSLKCSVMGYFKKYAHYVFVMALSWGLCHVLCGYINGHVVLVMLGRLGVCLVVPNLIMLLCYWQTKEFEVIVSKLAGMMGKSEVAKTQFTLEEVHLLRMLSKVLSSHGEAEYEPEPVPEKFNWEKFNNVARKHVVTALLRDELVARDDVPKNQKIYVQNMAKRTVLQSYRFVFLSKYIVNLLGDHGIKSILLKGVATAELYRVPEYRKSGDIDILLLNPKEIDKATEVLECAGYTVTERQLAHHQVVFVGSEGISVEVHVMLAEPFDNKETNNYLMELQKNIEKYTVTKSLMGVELPILCDGYHAFELLLHMLQHYLRSGFGLKLLCDWVVLWDKGLDEKNLAIYRSLVRESRIAGFSDMISSLCMCYLGLRKDSQVIINEVMDPESCYEFMLEIMEAEEFGKSSVERMVTLRSGGMQEFFREFHHQMQLNFMTLSKIWVLWPLLWMLTLVKFLINNRKIRKTSTLKIIWKANQRSQKMKKIRLFRKQ